MNELVGELITNIGVLTSVFFILPVLLDKTLYTFAKVTYKLAHKK